MRSRSLLPAFLLFFAAACSIRDAACGTPQQRQARQAAQEGAGQAPTAITGGGGAPDQAAASKTIAFLGDSITAGLGLLANQTFPETITEMFEAEGFDDIGIINGGVSGDTTAGGVRRVEQLLEPNVKILVVALGGNDALRG